MNIIMRIVLIILCLLFLAFVIANVSRKKLILRYSLLWLALALILLIFALFPDLIIDISSVFGFITPSNFVFALATFFLIAITLSQSAALSSQSRKIVNLSQELALANKEAQEREQANKQAEEQAKEHANEHAQQKSECTQNAANGACGVRDAHDASATHCAEP